MKKSYAIVLVLILAAAMLLSTACSGKKQDDQADEPGEKRDTLVIGTGEDITRLDPRRVFDVTSLALTKNIFEPLVRTDDAGNVLPGLALSWDVSDDGMEYTFHLAEGVKYHNGDPVEPEDVVFTVKDMVECEYSAPYMNFIDRAEVVDDTTVKIFYKYPYEPGLQLIAAYSGIVKESFMADGEESMSRSPIGCGPYKFVEWVQGDRVVIEINKDYFGEKPSIKKVTYKIITNQSTGAVALEKGEIDMYLHPDDADLATLEANPNLKVVKHSNATFYFMLLNTMNPPLDNIKVRQAIARCIDRDALIEASREGNGIPTYSLMTEGYPGYVEGYVKNEYDIEEGKRLLAEAGFPDGFEITLSTFSTNSVAIQCIQADLRKIGIIAEIEVLEAGAFWVAMEAGDFDITYYAWLGWTPDPDVALYPIYKSDEILGGNYGRYNNPEVDALLMAGKVEPDPGKRHEIYKEFQDIVNEEVPYIPVLWKISSVAFNKDLDIERIPIAEGWQIPRINWK